jgi:4-hydroxybenzoate polyprenyltransferase
MVRLGAGLLFLDRFLRLHLLFFTALWLLLGAASVRSIIATRDLVLALGVALCFHVYAYVLNDVIDLPLDRTQASRRHDPLVRGVISPARALLLAGIQPMLAVGLTHQLGGDRVAHSMIMAAFIFMGIYNLWGKRCPVPPVTDAFQGLAWGSLALYASHTLGGTSNAMTWFVVAYATTFTMFINGIHGSFRDLTTDMARGARTTAIWLGARPGSNQRTVVETSPTLALYAWAVLGALVALNATLMIRNDFAYSELEWTLIAAGVGALNLCGVVLQPLVLRPRGSSADIAWRLQMYVVVMALPLAFVACASATMMLVFVLLNLLALTLWDCTVEVVRWTWLSVWALSGKRSEARFRGDARAPTGR